MTIRQYEKNGLTLYRVAVNLRSNKDRSIRAGTERRGIKSLLDAKRLEKRLLREAQDQLKVKEFQGETWKSLIHKWYAFGVAHRIKTGSISALSLADYRNTILKWTEPVLNKAAKQVNSYDLLKCFSRMRDNGLSQTHQLKIRRIIKQIFDFGIKEAFLPEHFRIPTHEILIKKEESKPPEILTISEIQKLISEAMNDEHEWRYVWTFALLTGMRSGEIYALEWSDVDYENSLITVSKSYNGRFKSIKSTKAGYWRDVPISKELETVLRTLERSNGTEKHIFPRSATWARGGLAANLRAFCESKGLPSIKFHALRACFATQLIRQGVEPAKVMKVCGWRDLKTMQYYIRLAGIEVKGVTDGLSILPPTDTMANVVSFPIKE